MTALKINPKISGCLILSSLLFSASAFGINENLERQMLSHVERIVVVDSLLVDKDNFLSAYRLQPSAGRILSSRELRQAGIMPADGENPGTGFTNEFGDYMIWSQPDEEGILRLNERVKLTDGSWSAAEILPDVLNFPEEIGDTVVYGNAAFPFMLDDGITLYFASDGSESLGGYDIFEAQRDPSDGSYLLPRNIGMPFNSPYDDYMMAIDPLTGAGWWVSDRNQIDGKLTLYVYVLKDDRVNVDPEDEDLSIYATLSGWRDVQNEEDIAEASAVRNEIARIKPVSAKKQDFTLRIPGGGVYHYFSDFRNNAAASKMRSYLELENKVEKNRKELSDLRHKLYLAGKDRKSALKLQEKEAQLRLDEQKLRTTLSDIIKLETSISK